jgi:hypothetical protein
VARAGLRWTAWLEESSEDGRHGKAWRRRAVRDARPAACTRRSMGGISHGGEAAGFTVGNGKQGRRWSSCANGKMGKKVGVWLLYVEEAGEGLEACLHGVAQR